MTRTARAAYPRAVLKDRSECRSGLNSSIRKDGAGQHNWGSIADEQLLETAAIEDEILEAGRDLEEEDLNNLKKSTALETIPGATADQKPELISSKTNVSQEELEEARKYRKNALKRHGDIDLVHIARTSSAVAGAAPLSDGSAYRAGQDNKMIHTSNATVPGL